MVDLILRYFVRVFIVSSMCFFLTSPYAFSAEVTLEVRVAATFTDNARLSEVNETSDKIATAGIWLEASESTNRFDGSIATNINHNVYTDNTFDDETFASLDGTGKIKLFPDTFSWIFTNNFGKVEIDPFQVDTPTNRENINRFATGPLFVFQLGTVTAFEVEGQYKNTHFEKSDFDSQNISGRISFIRQLSAARSVALNVTADRVNFDDNDKYSDYDLQSASLSIQSRISRGDLNASIGVNSIHDNGSSSDGLLTNISWRREISSRSSVSIDYDRRFSDSGDLFQRYQEIENRLDASSETSGSSDPLEISRVSIGYGLAGITNSMNISISQSSYDYENDNFLDRDIAGLRVDAEKQIGPAWRVLVSASVQKSQYDLSARDDDYLEGSISLQRRLSRTLAMSFSARHLNRESNVSGFDYSTNRYAILFTYSPFAAQEAS